MTPPQPMNDLSRDGTGHGMIGMRERAMAAGGTVTAQPTSGGGFSVHAALPLDAEDLGRAASEIDGPGSARSTCAPDRRTEDEMR
jgi:signal transduction histidine kinase